MKILYFITSLSLGGAEKVTLNLAEKMIEKGHVVKVVYMFGDAKIFSSNRNLEIIPLYISSYADIFNAFFKVRKIVKTFQPEVVHSHMYHANLFMRVYRFFFSLKKLINSAHSSIEGSNFGMLLYKLTNFLSDLNTNVSNSALKAFINNGAFNEKNSIVVYNGVDVNKFLKKSFEIKATRKLITVGRFAPEKDYLNLINAINIVKKNYNHNFELTIVGDGPEFSNIQEIIKLMNLEDVVKLPGRKDNIPDLLNSSECLILSSKFEGLPTVIMEAMACGCYVIATDCGGCAEIMKDNFGILVPVSDSIALANAIISYLNFPQDFVCNSSKMAREIIVNNFSLDVAVKKWEEIYKL